MTIASLTKALQHFCETLPDGPETDAQLLRRFAAERDEAAFAALVRRHGSMVLGVCRRILRHTHDAEDAFQATFLILARKAGSVVKRDSLGCWLHRVAYRVALEADAINTRRRAMEKQLPNIPHPATEPESPSDWQPLLDEELSRLPPKFRSAIVLCDLEGLTRKEAARRLNVPEGTLSGRLTAARRMLAKRLSRRGWALGTHALAAALPQGAASANASAALVNSTAKAAALVAAGWCGVSNAAVLATGVLQAMFMEKVKLTVGTLLALTALALGGLAYRGAPAPALAQAPRPEKREAVKPPNDLEALRKKVELLEINLQIVLEKVRAQEIEIRALKEKPKDKSPPKDPNTVGPKSGPGGEANGVKLNEPSNHVEGQVRKTDGNLVTISIGSDAGLMRGHTLEVFRLGQNPKYLGRIKIIEVARTQTVGQAADRMKGTLEVGDRVANRITGGR